MKKLEKVEKLGEAWKDLKENVQFCHRDPDPGLPVSFTDVGFSGQNERAQKSKILHLFINC